MDLHQSYTLGSIIEHMAPISTKSDKMQKATKCTVRDPEMAVPYTGKKKTCTLQRFDEFANRKRKQSHEK